jgi:hypothetical protein
LQGKGLNIDKDPNDENVLKFEADVDEKVIRCMIVCNFDYSLLTFCAILPEEIHEERLPKVLELMARVNESMWYGTFVINFETLILSCVTTLPFNNARISNEQLERLCFNNLLNIHHFQDGFSKVNTTDLTPAEAFLMLKFDD